MRKDIFLKVFKDQWLSDQPTAYNFFFLRGFDGTSVNQPYCYHHLRLFRTGIVRWPCTDTQLLNGQKQGNCEHKSTNYQGPNQQGIWARF